jgi:hypothetical protein
MFVVRFFSLVIHLHLTTSHKMSRLNRWFLIITLNLTTSHKMSRLNRWFLIITLNLTTSHKMSRLNRWFLIITLHLTTSHKMSRLNRWFLIITLDEICASPDVVIEEDTRDIRVDESWWTIGIQVFFPFIIAGFGTVGAGMVLDIVQVSRLDLLVPIRNILSVTTKCPGENHDFVLITSLFVFLVNQSSTNSHQLLYHEYLLQ